MPLRQSYEQPSIIAAFMLRFSEQRTQNIVVYSKVIVVERMLISLNSEVETAVSSVQSLSCHKLLTRLSEVPDADVA